MDQNEHFQFDFLDDLIARKVNGENISVGEFDWAFHERQLAELESKLDLTYAEFTLPEDCDRTLVNEFLVSLRLETYQ
jgi:hypothetical protein